MVTVTDVFNSDRELIRQTVTFDVTDDRVLSYIAAVGLPLRGEAVAISDGKPTRRDPSAAPYPEGSPVPWAIDPELPIWGYIVGYDTATRRLEVAPKR